jgi:hypothetical protein
VNSWILFHFSTLVRPRIARSGEAGRQGASPLTPRLELHQSRTYYHLTKKNMQFNLILIVGLLLLSGCTRHDEITYRIILPDQYMGWVRVDFEVKSRPTFDSHNVLTFHIGTDGRAQSSSLLVYSVPTKYEFFYQTEQGLRSVPDNFVDHNLDAGGITSRSDDPHFGSSWYFFVGPKSYRNQHPQSEFVSHSSPLPTPGPLSLQHP